MVLTRLHTGAASDTAVNIINLLVDTHNTEIVKVCLYTVVWTSCDSYFDVVVGREDQFLDLAGQLIGVDVAFDTVCVADTGHDVTGADCRVAVVIGFHIHVTHLDINIGDVFLDVFVYFFDILKFDSRNV